MFLTAILIIPGACATMTDTHLGLTQDAAPPPPAADIEADPLFSQPYIDIDEWRNEPVRHRYIHGGFTGTETRFSY
jgi:hypothetical protein